MALILNGRGEPEIPDAIKRRLATLGGGFSLTMRSGNWWLMERWRENDPRWRYVQNGSIPEHEAVDGIGAFPIDIGFDQMPAWIEKSLREFPVRDLKNLAAKFAEGEGESPEAVSIKGQLMEDVIQQVTAPKGVTGRRTKDTKKTTNQGE